MITFPSWFWPAICWWLIACGTAVIAWVLADCRAKSRRSKAAAEAPFFALAEVRVDGLDAPSRVAGIARAITDALHVDGYVVTVRITPYRFPTAAPEEGTHA